MKRRNLWFISVAVAMIITVLLVAYTGVHPTTAITPPAPTAQPVAAVAIPSLLPASNAAEHIRTYGQLLHADLKHYAATKPWAIPLDLSDAAHVMLDEPIFCCARGDLWITRSDADPLPDVLKRAATETEHIVPDRISYIVWTTSRRGESVAAAICPTGDGYQIISAGNRRPIPWKRAYQWDRAMTWDDDGATRLIVPTDRGVSIITVADNLTEDYQQLTDERSLPAPQVLFDLNGLLAWIPCDAVGATSRPAAATQVARYLNGKWISLDSDDWKQPIIHLVPMLDGSVLQIRRAEGDQVDLAMVPLDATTVDRKEIAGLVEQMGDEDPDKRKAAFERLTQYGPSIFALLKELQTDAVPEAQARINELLQGKLTSKLGGMEINGLRLTVAARLHDGGIVMYAPDGVSIPRDQDDPLIINPDYLVIRPGRAVQDLPAELVHKLPPSAKISGMHDEWLVETDELGLTRFLPPDQLVPLLRKPEQEFTRLVAIDGRGRWLLRRPESSPASSRSSSRPDHSSETLVLDPTVPDPSPQLKLWRIDTGNEAGWTQSGWPAIRRGKDFWLINQTGWQLVDATEDKFITSDPAPATASTEPTTQPTFTGIDADGNRYSDGQASITLTTPKGISTTWPLPADYQGDSDTPARIVRANDGVLFLFNSPDRILRIQPTPDESQPFAPGGIFSRGIPRLLNTRRAWLDPAGRINVIYGDHYLAIIFPTGQIPSALSPKILTQDLGISDPE